MTTLSLVLIPAKETLPLESLALETPKGASVEVWLEQRAALLLGDDSIKIAPLLLPGSNDGDAGLYAYSYSIVPGLVKNVRATRLAMACGKLSTRFCGDVLLFRFKAERYFDLSVDEICGAACISPDLRSIIQVALNKEKSPHVPEWLANASQQNYHDSATIARLASVMNPRADVDESIESSDESDESSDEASYDDIVSTSDDGNLGNVTTTLSDGGVNEGKQFVARTSLCLQCRGPSDSLCPDCGGAYFCEKPRQCRQIGWSHECLCCTWKLYMDRRAELSTFPFDEWHLQLLGRDCQVSEEPYQRYLTRELGVALDQSSWWRTEVQGWSGGDSQSAQTVDASIRHSYEEGFAPVTLIPPDQSVAADDLANLDVVSRNSCGLLHLDSWQNYYKLRNIPLSSPVALLLTFPLTIYYSIVKFGEVPVTVAKMLSRPLRIHVVGVEKEMNFLDIFREISYLLPQDLLELTFVVRRDMLPPKSRKLGAMNAPFLDLQLTTNLKLLVVSGTYGGDLDPNFDCGSGPPDMIVGLNAGLFAYESWRSVITYLYGHKGVVGVFTDYNEHSGMNCAALGGAKSRESLCINPFRQPRAMPVMSMNLPQFSNGFMYVYNGQELE